MMQRHHKRAGKEICEGDLCAKMEREQLAWGWALEYHSSPAQMS